MRMMIPTFLGFSGAKHEVGDHEILKAQMVVANDNNDARMRENLQVTLVRMQTTKLAALNSKYNTETQPVCPGRFGLHFL